MELGKWKWKYLLKLLKVICVSWEQELLKEASLEEPKPNPVTSIKTFSFFSWGGVAQSMKEESECISSFIFPILE